jgi:hypothetical protein
MALSHRPGDYNVICDFTGFKVHASDTVKTWQGYRVRAQDWEPRHPQDFVRGKRDNQNVPDPRPEETDNFLTANEVTRGSL